MAGMLWRLLIAAICVVLAYALIPAVIELLGVPVSAPLLTIIRVCIAGLAVFYVLRGPGPPWPTS